MDLIVFDICEAYDCQVADEISLILQLGDFFGKVVICVEPKVCPLCNAALVVEHSVWKVKASCQQCHCYEWLETATSEPDEPKKAKVDDLYRQQRNGTPTRRI